MTLLRVNWGRAFATFLLTLTVLAVIVDIVIWGGQRFRPPPVSFIKGASPYVAEMFYSVAYAAMGALLATRLPRNLLGWIFLLLGLAMASQMTATFIVEQGHQAFRQLDYPTLFAAWLSSSFHLPFTILLTTVVFLRFPTGHLLSARWAVAGWMTFIGALLVAFGVGLSPVGLAWFPSLPNIYAAPSAMGPTLQIVSIAGLALTVAGVVLATISMVARYRASADVQRAQMRWIAAAVLILAGAGLPFIVLRYGLDADYQSAYLSLTVALIAGCFLPIAAAVAILRHRLYDIDLILNRALVYIPLSALLAGLYTAGVALFQRVFVALTNDKSDAAIVITTLVLAAMFTPIKNALQAFVDRRFKPVGPAMSGPSEDIALTVEQRVMLLERRIARMEVGASPNDLEDY
jgi:hypothetical protein